MASERNSYVWLDRALGGTPVWNLGQLSQADVGVLNQAVRAGYLVKERAHWRGMSNTKKAVWFRVDDVPPQEVMAAQYRNGVPAQYSSSASE